MVFTVLAAVDLSGKLNFELLFPTKPSIAELRARVDRDVGMEGQLRRPNVPFAVSRVQVFDERLQMWVDLVAAVQLEDYCQLYVFQVESPYCRDLPGHIPAPQRPTATGIGSPVRGDPDMRAVSPQRVRGPSPDVVPPHQELSPFRQRQREIDLRSAAAESPAPAHSDKVRTVYDDLDQSRSRKVTLEDWQKNFTDLRLAEPEGMLTAGTVEDLFNEKADKNKDTVVTFQEFSRFAESYPKLLDSLYYRGRAIVHERERKSNIKRAKEDADLLQQKVDEATDLLNQQERAALEHGGKVKDSEANIQRAEDDAANTKKDADRAQQELADERKLRGDKNAAKDRAKEELRGKDGDLRAQQRNVSAAEKKKEQKQAEIARQAAEIEKLEKLLADKKEEKNKQEGELADADRKVSEEQAAAADIERAKDDLQTKLDAASAELSDADKALQEKLKEEEAAKRAHREQQQKLQQAQAAHDRELKEEQAQKAKQDSKQRMLARAEDSLNEHNKVVAELEDNDRTKDEERGQQQQKENSIVESEIRLREQRDAVEQREQELSLAANEFAAETGRVRSPGASLRPSSSPQRLY